ncbi:MAG TPA: LysM peptidoglycan-binding domain-containing protein [Terracidiphilus sp.]
MRLGRMWYRYFGCAMLALSLAGCNPSTSNNASPGAQPQATAPALTQAPSSAQAAAPAPSAPSRQQQQLRVLIQQVEDAYARGEAEYHKGRLREAKQQFDRAVDLMLLSGIDIKSTPELQEEFDRIVDAVHALEMEALKQGNGFVPKEEETPSDVAENVTFEVDPNIVARARADLATTKSDLPLVVNEYVASYISFFSSTQRGHNTLLHSFERAGRYKAMIQRILAEEGVPQDLIYLAVAESGFQPRALNRRSHAGGMWQFMPRGNYGLVRNAYVDERFDPEKSTRAYARYMKFIYDQLGDWYLSMAAYDHGTGNIQREVEKTGYADYWELYKRGELPKETKNYVPEILAAIIIANHPQQYGFDDVTLDPPVLTDTVTINYPVSLHLVSDIVGVPVDELTALNPSLLRMTTPPDMPFDLHLPGGASAVFQQLIALIPEGKRNAWRYHHVAEGDTLASVALRYHVTETALAEANHIRVRDGIEGVEALLVPAAPVAEPVRTRIYTARKGDSLVTIADRFGVSLSQLRRWNKVTGTKVQPGQRLYVADPATVHNTATRAHRAAGSQAGAHTQSAPAKSTARPSTPQAAPRKNAAPAAKKPPVNHPAASAATKKRGAANAGKSPARKSASSSRANTEK